MIEQPQQKPTSIRNTIVSDVPPFKEELSPETIAARAELHKACEEETARREKSPFKNMFDKAYPGYDCFIEEADDGTKLPFKPATVAKWLHENENVKTDIKTGILYFFDGNSWKSNGEAYLQKIVSTILGKEDKESHFRNILFSLKSFTFCNIEFSTKIAVENGLLDVETLTLTPFNAEEMPFHALPEKYDPAAQAPNFEEFIKEVVNPDDIATIQEWSGYLLLPDYRFHKLCWLHGAGRNGKGVWQRTMEGILGEDNVSSVGLEEFDADHRFALKQLYGKLFNPCSEPTTSRVLQTELLKKATGQDTIEAEIKGKQQRLQFRNTAKITVLANKFPRVNDRTTAFRERRLFLKFPNEFVGKDQIQNLEQIWLSNPEERSGILNWMLQGLLRLLSNGCFTESKSQQETEAEFLKASDTISAFLNEMAVFNKNMVTTRTEAFESYKNYCDIFGLEAQSDKRFTERLKDTPKISLGYIHKPKQERVWKGIGLRKIDDEGKIITPTTLATLATDLGVFHPLKVFEEVSKNRESIEGSKSVASVAAPKETYPNRYCSKECNNFDKPTCTAPNWQSLNKKSELPLKCPGYSYVAEEEVS